MPSAGDFLRAICADPDAGALALADSPYLLGATQLDLSHNPVSERVREVLRIRLGHPTVMPGG